MGEAERRKEKDLVTARDAANVTEGSKPCDNAGARNHDPLPERFSRDRDVIYHVNF